ncbi:MAG: deaminase [Patescibacteria group bacterium]
MQSVIVAYIPVLHEGYRRFFERHPDAKELYLFGSDVIASYEHLVKDIRRIDPKLIQQSLTAWNRFERVVILDADAITRVQDMRTPLIVSDDDVTAELVTKYFSHHLVERDTIFLRWDKMKSIEPTKITPDVEMSTDEFDREMMEIAKAEGEKSRDWWRRIGALAVRDGKILLRAHNIYTPSDQIAYDEGDPRSNFKAGQHIESSLALHAEAGLVAHAAKEGIRLAGANVYSDTFPCPSCAKQLAYSGIKKLYYRNGYSVLDGERILRSQGVQIIFVKPDIDRPSADQI